ncbi:hypothetical protein [Marinitenerispora sediminis]|uniref:Lipoprotein n=1 Tax=Marinitenerispora sediminis TaxID=1931232 RepID=A0A368T8E2_9ACTN|nr:hypothetical protein [Marinitenerispora sediminis]RCV51351.1 hypothetical protein DEF28_15620 [Marinitenerispora sediminis]RCV57179.1 hypothetical protein DEF23_11195 [Marinitenerispora sediminis]RCV60314.1 hypothetical protein DEF24_07505 [Marinitenerispora sediminis]
MAHPPRLRKAAAAALTAVTALTALSGCAGGGAAAPEEADPNAEAAGMLHQAQMVQYGSAKLIADQSESGSYARLGTVRATEQLREATESDRPDCLDSVNRWARLGEVRDAPASFAVFGDEHGTISHLLLDLPDGVAERAMDIELPEECSEYTATTEDGQTSAFTVRPLELATLADESRAAVVETRMGGDTLRLHTLLYRNGDYLGSTSVLAPADRSQRSEETLVGFTEEALERERKVLS